MKPRKLLTGIMALALVCAVPVNLSSAVKDFSITAHAISDGTKIVAGNLSCTVLSTDEDGTVNLEVNGFSDGVGDAKTLEFPEIVDDIPVRYISIVAGAFSDSSLTEAILPDTIESIDNDEENNGAFKNCVSLKKVHLPEGGNFHCIFSGTFSGCSALAEINIPDSVNEIKTDAFSETLLLTNQEEEPIKYIDNWAISCVEGIPLEFKEGTVGIANDFLGGKETGTLLLEFPSSLRCIGTNAFSGAEEINTIIIPEKTEIVRDNAFKNTGIQEVIFPGEVSFIGNDAFSGCSNLTSVQFAKTVGSIGSYAFNGDTNLTSVQFGGEMLGNFGEGAFSGCSSLPEIVLPEGEITTIPLEMFSGCTKLASIDFPDSLTSIPDAASSFSGTALYADGLSDLKYVDNWAIKVNSGFDGDSITVKDGTVGIAGGTFANQTNLISVEFPDTLKYISNDAFNGCTALTSAPLPDSLIIIDIRAFYQCSALTSVTLPESLTSIEDEAFQDCDSLTSITIPESVIFMDLDAFCSCKLLTSITIENPDCIIYGDSSTISNEYRLSWGPGYFYYDGTIYGYADSTAQAYAEEYGYKFESLGNKLVQGDADGDGELTVADAVLVQKFLLGKVSLPNWESCDLYPDEKINVFDLLALKRKLIYQ